MSNIVVTLDLETLEHALQRWEIDYGFVRWSKKEESKYKRFFTGLEGTRFPLIAFGERLPGRKLDLKYARIYVGKAVLSEFEEGEVLEWWKDEDGNIYLDKRGARSSPTEVTEQVGLGKQERNLYESVKRALESHFSDKKHYFEVTGGKGQARPSNEIKRALDKDTLFMINYEGMFPDITGWVEEDGLKRLVVVEVKRGAVGISDVYQAKKYGDVYKAKYAFLISPEPLEEEIRRFLTDRPDITAFFGYRVTLAKLNEAGSLTLEIS